MINSESPIVRTINVKSPINELSERLAFLQQLTLAIFSVGGQTAFDIVKPNVVSGLQNLAVAYSEAYKPGDIPQEQPNPLINNETDPEVN